jgi:hypothetical protein
VSGWVTRAVWVPVRVDTRLVGGEIPLGVTSRRSPHRRGTRTRGGRPRSVKRELAVCKAEHTSASVPPVRQAALKDGVGCKHRHFRKSFNKSIELGTGPARQIPDIKSRAESRARLARVLLPPKARAGLVWRQRKLVRLSRFWGDAYARAESVSSRVGRRYWRSALHRAVGGETSGWGELTAESAFLGRVGPASTSVTATSVLPPLFRPSSAQQPRVFECVHCGRTTTMPTVCRHCGSGRARGRWVNGVWQRGPGHPESR